MLTSEQLEIRTLAREFAEGEIRPHSARWDAEAALDDTIFAALAELGFLGMLVPEEHGGLAFDLTTFVTVIEELARADAAVALSVLIHNGPVAGILLAHGDDDLRTTWLPRLAAGEALGAFALTEPEAGSDAAALSCEARRSDGGWTLHGTKTWVTNGARAAAVLVFARTGPGEREIGCFLVEPSADGYRVGERTTTMGLRASETVDVVLEGAPAVLVGAPDRGFAYALEALDVGRIGVAAQAVGIGRAALEQATGYAVEREQFGRSIADFGAVQEKLARMAGRVAAARALTLSAAASFEAARGTDAPLPTAGEGAESLAAQAALAKVTASEAAMWAADEAVQVFGGYGYMRDYPVEKLMRDAKGTEIYEGTNEVLRYVVAREILKPARSPA